MKARGRASSIIKTIDEIDETKLTEPLTEPHAKAVACEWIGERYGDMPGALSLLSSHPSSEARARMVASAGSEGTAGMTDAEWQALGEICADST